MSSINLSKTCGSLSTFQCFNGGICDESTSTCVQCSNGWTHNRGFFKFNDCSQNIIVCIVLASIFGTSSLFIGLRCLIASRKYQAIRRRILVSNGLANVFACFYVVSHSLSGFELTIAPLVFCGITMVLYNYIVYLNTKADMGPILAIANKSPTKTYQISMIWNTAGALANIACLILMIVAYINRDDVRFNNTLVAHGFVTGIIVNSNLFTLRRMRLTLISIIRKSTTATQSTNKVELLVFLNKLERANRDGIPTLVFVIALLSLLPVLFIVCKSIPYIWINHYAMVLIWNAWGNGAYLYCAGYKNQLPPGYRTIKDGSKTTLSNTVQPINSQGTGTGTHVAIAPVLVDHHLETDYVSS